MISEYSYEIFISYRKKDNQSDKWVTHFVKSLKEELNTMFKEEVSIYFDENPHDGIVESYDVDESLKDKVKCLIFIPILSRTYCDPKCFAWSKEFIPFIRFAKNDGLGLKIKLANGNVANRVIPVRIHELEEGDIELFEKELSSPIRGVDFIYGELGVSRPLNPSDNRELNNYDLSYKNQINKLAFSVYQVITSISSEHEEPKKSSKNTHIKHHQRKYTKRKLSPTLIGAISILMITLLSYLIYNYTFKPDPLVLVMDSAHPNRVYDEGTLKAGGTNADVISDILIDLPIRCQRETISPLWHRHEEMLEFNPELIIIHFSGFRQDWGSSEPRIKLKLLIEYFINSNTKFLIYSRATDSALQSKVDILLSENYESDPNLRNRVYVFGLMDYGEPKWKDPVVSNSLKMKVKDILVIQ